MPPKSTSRKITKQLTESETQQLDKSPNSSTSDKNQLSTDDTSTKEVVADKTINNKTGKKGLSDKALSSVLSVAELKSSSIIDEPEIETDKFTQVLDKLELFVKEAKEITSLVKILQKEHVKLQKQTNKKTKKVGSETSKRNPSGFAKPTKLSDELCTFLGEPPGASMARTIVTKFINEYIKKNNLQDQTDKRHIIPDSKLKSILSIKDGDKLTYFNLQTYIKQHFIKDG